MKQRQAKKLARSSLPRWLRLPAHVQREAERRLDRAYARRPPTPFVGGPSLVRRWGDATRLRRLLQRGPAEGERVEELGVEERELRYTPAGLFRLARRGRCLRLLGPPWAPPR